MALGAKTENSCLIIPAGESITTAAGVKFTHIEPGHYIFHGREQQGQKSWEEQSRELDQRIAEARVFLANRGAVDHAG